MSDALREKLSTSVLEQIDKAISEATGLQSKIAEYEEKLREPFCALTRNTRRNLMISSFATSVIALTGMIPTKIETLGISLETVPHQIFLAVLALIVLYNAISFFFYATVDAQRYRTIYRLYQQLRQDATSMFYELQDRDLARLNSLFIRKSEERNTPLRPYEQILLIDSGSLFVRDDKDFWDALSLQTDIEKNELAAQVLELRSQLIQMKNTLYDNYLAKYRPHFSYSWRLSVEYGLPATVTIIAVVSISLALFGVLPWTQQH